MKFVQLLSVLFLAPLLVAAVPCESNSMTPTKPAGGPTSSPSGPTTSPVPTPPSMPGKPSSPAGGSTTPSNPTTLPGNQKPPPSTTSPLPGPPGKNGGSPTTTITVTQTSTATPVSNCSTGSVQCCNSVQSSNTNVIQSLMGLLGAAVGADVPVGVQCSGLGSTCNSHAVCCENNSFNGLIALGCVPIIIDL